MSTKTGDNRNRLHDRDPGPVSPPNERQQEKSHLESNFNEPDDRTTALISQERTTENTPEFSKDVANADRSSLQTTQIHEDPDPIVKGFNTISAKKDVARAIFIGLAGALVGILGHHFFLSYLDGRIVEGQWQFWIRNASNAFSQVVVMFIGLVVTSLLTQAIWRQMSLKYTQIAIIDHSFSLPSPISILALVYKRCASTSGIPLALSILVQSLVIVSILAPNSLSIGVSGWNNITTMIPGLDFANMNLSQVQIPIFQSFTSAQLLALSSLDNFWEPPLGCEASCLFFLEYQAPALSCRNLMESEISLQPPNGNNTWAFFATGVSYPNTGWGDPYPSFWMNYIPNTSESIEQGMELAVNETGPMGGLQCNFVDGTYRAGFGLANGLKSVSTTLVSYSNGSTQGCSWTSPKNTTYCSNYSSRASSFSTGFVPFAKSQEWVWTVVDGISGWETEVWSTAGEPIWSHFMQFNATASSTFLSVPSPNMSSAAEDLFSNITLAAILSSQQTKVGSILASDVKSVWRYTPHILWSIYGPALALLLLASAIYAQYSIFGHGISMNKHFSTLLISTRNKDLDKVCALNPDIFMEKRLHFDSSQRRFDTEAELVVSERLPRDTNVISGDSPQRSKVADFDLSFDEEKSGHSRKGMPDGWARVIMITAFIMAVLLSGGHHVFLSHFNGQKVSLFSQFWTKNISNGFAQAATLCLQLVATYSLTQTVWQMVGVQGIAITTINHLFSLPSSDALLSLLTESWYISLMPAAFMVLSIHVLPLVSTLAPNALTVSSSGKTPFNLTIPAIDYSNSLWEDAGTPILAMQSSPDLLWNIPDDCGVACEYKFEYEAPGFSCIDSPVDSSFTFDYVPGVGWPFVYFAPYGGGPRGGVWDPSENYTFGVEYFPAALEVTNSSTPVVLSSGTPARSLCRLQDATYEAHFLYSNGTKTISTTILHYDNSFTESCLWNNTPPLSLACQGYANSSYAFWVMLVWAAFLDHANGTSVWSPVKLGVPLQRIFNLHNDTEDGTISTSLKVSNMSEGIVDLFSNFTLGCVAGSFNSTTVNALRWGDTIWKFDVANLWYVYGSAHALTLLVLLYGLYCIRSNGKALDNNFSTLMLATRGEELDNAVQNAPDYDALMKLRLRKEKGRYFVVDDDHVDGSAEQRHLESA